MTNGDRAKSTKCPPKAELVDKPDKRKCLLPADTLTQRNRP